MADLTPRPPDWVATAPIQITRDVAIAAPPSAVWSVIADNERWVDWFPGFRSCSWSPNAAPNVTPGVGTTRHVHQDQFRVVEEITRWVPDHEWSMTVTKINIGVLSAMAENVVLTANGNGGTHVSWTIGASTSRWARLVRPILQRKATNGLEGALTGLSERSERVQPPTSA